MNYEEYKEAVAKAILWSERYYNDNPIATDAEYTELSQSIKTYESQNPDKIIAQTPSQNVGVSVRADAFEKKAHIDPMTSLEDLFPYQKKYDEDRNLLPSDWYEWSSKFPKGTQYYAEPKFDGAALSVTYGLDGNVTTAITRGDGKIGEDISANLPYIMNIPDNVDTDNVLEIRGEVVILEDDFISANKYRVSQGKEPFSNRRNAASGGLRSLESESVSGYKLTFIPYSFGNNEKDFEKQTDEVLWLKAQGFEFYGSDDITRVGTADEIMAIYNEMQDNRDKYKMLIDGMVVKINDKHLQAELGQTNHHPRWASALKFRPVEVTATLGKVILQVGKTGAIAPVAELADPVEIDGVIVSRVYLHNFDDIAKKDIRVGDKITVIRSGDVIPKIVGVFTDRRDGSEKIIQRPTSCPACGCKELDESEVVIYCLNPICDAKIKGRLSYSAGRKALNMDALGESTIEALVDSKMVSNLIDLFLITEKQLLMLDGFKAKKAKKVYDAIQSALGCDGDRLLNAIDIPKVGSSASQKLAEVFKERIFDMNNPITFDELVKIEDIGSEIAGNFVSFMAEHSEYVTALVDMVKPEFKEDLVLGSSLAGKKLVITGTLSKPRGDFKALAEAHGAKVSGSVSKNTDYLLAGANAGSKATKAESLGVIILSEDDFMKLIEG